MRQSPQDERTTDLVESQSYIASRQQPWKIQLGTLAQPSSADEFLYDYCATPQFLGASCASNNGNVMGQKRGSLGGIQTIYSYDYLNRLLSATESGNGPGYSRSFGYDAYSNGWVAANSGVALSSFTPTSAANFAANNRLLINNAAYDASGNQTAIGGYTFKWDGENRMVESVIGGVTTAYVYDGEGRRVKKVKTTTAPATTTETRFVYNASGALAGEYGPVEAESDTEYFMADHLGSTRLVTSRTGAPKRTFDYLPFGEEIPQGVSGRGALYPADGATPTSGKKFTGQYRDSETGLDYFGARYLSSALGRFTSPDPSPSGITIQDPQSWNLYSYVRNRPTRFVDGNGLWPTELHKSIIEIALSGYMSPGEIARLSERQVVMDYRPNSQSADLAYQHSMRSPNHSAAGGAIATWGFVVARGNSATAMLGPGGTLTPAALDYLGDALHTLQDFASPAHTNSNGEPYIWRGPFWENVRIAGHFLGESGPAVDWSRFGQAIRLTMALIVQYAPDAARARGLTAENLDAEAARRISAYITSRFSTPQSGTMFGPSQAIREDAARQCALGNSAACGF